jgi:hypothetical protein
MKLLAQFTESTKKEFIDYFEKFLNDNHMRGSFKFDYKKSTITTQI